MDQQDFDALDQRVAARAKRMWQEAGRPEGGSNQYLENARELVAIEEVALPKIDPETAAEPRIEEASLLHNLGEFPTLRDQGDEQAFPDPDLPDADLPDTEDDPDDEGRPDQPPLPDLPPRPARR